MPTKIGQQNIACKLRQSQPAINKHTVDHNYNIVHSTMAKNKNHYHATIMYYYAQRAKLNDNVNIINHTSCSTGQFILQSS